jgi:hypothetical protein
MKKSVLVFGLIIILFSALSFALIAQLPSNTNLLVINKNTTNTASQKNITAQQTTASPQIVSIITPPKNIITNNSENVQGPIQNAIQPTSIEQVREEVVSNIPCVQPQEPNASINLICPAKDVLIVDWPPLPYDFEIGDCGIKGKEALVKEYILQLEQRLKACLNSINSNAERFRTQKQAIINYINSIPSYNPNAYLECIREHPTSETVGRMMPAAVSRPSMPLFGNCYESAELAEGLGIDEGYAYTHLLESMIEAVNKTCEAVQILNEDMVCLCDDVADYVNDMHWLWPEDKNILIAMFQHLGVKESEIFRQANITASWFYYLNNSYSTLYNPDYVSCLPRFGLQRELRREVINALKNSGQPNLTKENLSSDSADELKRFEKFISKQIKKEEIKNIKELKEENSSVYLVEIKKPARLFWIIPVQINSELRVDQKTGETKEKRPWWSFFAGG